MFCPKCGFKDDDPQTFCGNCGAKLKDSPEKKDSTTLSKFIGKILVVFVLLVILIILANVLLSIFIPIKQNSISTSGIPSTPPPTIVKNTYYLNEPATDGNIQISVLKIWDGDRKEANNKEFYVELSVKNLQTDKKIQILDNDFLFINSAGQRYPSNEYDFTHRITVTELGGSSFGCGAEYLQLPCNLFPGESQTYDVKGIVPQNSQGLKLRFNYGGPSGKGSDGPFVYFDLSQTA